MGLSVSGFRTSLEPFWIIWDQKLILGPFCAILDQIGHNGANGTKWSNMVRNNPKWSQAVTLGPKWPQWSYKRT